MGVQLQMLLAATAMWFGFEGKAWCPLSSTSAEGTKETSVRIADAMIQIV